MVHTLVRICVKNLAAILIVPPDANSCQRNGRVERHKRSRCRKVHRCSPRWQTCQSRRDRFFDRIFGTECREELEWAVYQLGRSRMLTVQTKAIEWHSPASDRAIHSCAKFLNSALLRHSFHTVTQAAICIRLDAPISELYIR